MFTLEGNNRYYPKYYYLDSSIPPFLPYKNFSMSLTRRNFLRTGAATLAGSALYLNKLSAAVKDNAILGLQLYSVRSDMTKDPAGTLKQLADMGYRYVEHASYVDRKMYGLTVPEFRKLLDGLGMKMHSGHTVMSMKHWDAAKKDFTDAWKYTVDDAAIAGQKYVISPSIDGGMRKNADDFLRFMDIFNKSGELCKKSGMKFGYHNHDFEFSEKLNGEMMYDIIMKKTDPKLVVQQLDIGKYEKRRRRCNGHLKKISGKI